MTKVLLKRLKCGPVILAGLLFVISACKENPPVEPVERVLNDSIYVRGGNTYSLDLDEDGTEDLVLQGRQDYSPGGQNNGRIAVRLSGAGYSVHAQMESDTICLDTLIRDGHMTFDFRNCSGGNIYQTYEEPFALLIADSIPDRIAFSFEAADSLPIWIYNFSQPAFPWPGATYYEVERGSREPLESGGWLAVQLPGGKRYAVRIRLYATYLYIERVRQLL